MPIAVVIPTLNEERALGRTLEALRRGGEAAAVVVVADCGSRDRTVSIASASGAIVTGGPELGSRAAAMNAGAACALRHAPDAEAIWFLHADSIPPPGWPRAIVERLRDPRVVGGAFDFRWDLEGLPWRKSVPLRLVGLANRIRFRVTGIYFGDQGIFVRPDALARVGGMPPVDLMEDVAICRALKRIGRLRLARAVVTTSPRRFLRHGIVRQTLIDLVLLITERLGMRWEWARGWYGEERRDGGGERREGMSE